MPVSFEDFRSALPHAPARDAWGLVLTDAEAQQVAADEQASRAWYDYFLATTAPAPTAPAAAPLGGHELPVAAAPGFAAAPPPAPVAAPWTPTPAESPERKSRVGL